MLSPHFVDRKSPPPTKLLPESVLNPPRQYSHPPLTNDSRCSSYVRFQSNRLIMFPVHFLLLYHSQMHDQLSHEVTFDGFWEAQKYKDCPHRVPRAATAPPPIMSP